MDVPTTVADALGAHEICGDLRRVVVDYIAMTIADFETSIDDPDLEDTVEVILDDLRLMKSSIEARAWGFSNKSDVAE